MHDKIIRFGLVAESTGLSRSTIWRKENEGTFPNRIQISAQCVGWRQSEITQWIATRPQIVSQKNIIAANDCNNFKIVAVGGASSC